ISCCSRRTSAPATAAPQAATTRCARRRSTGCGCYPAPSPYDACMNGLGALELLARAGFFVKGVLYVVVGVLALQVAAKAGGRVTGTRGAFGTVLAQPYGRTLLLLAAVGL